MGTKTRKEMKKMPDEEDSVLTVALHSICI